jgi:hypothetical protein
MVGGSLAGGWMLYALGEDHRAYMVIFAASSLLRLATVPFLRRVPTPALRPVPVATRTVAVRPSAGSLDRPILPSLPREAGGEGGATSPPPSGAGLGGSGAGVAGGRSVR